MHLYISRHSKITRTEIIRRLLLGITARQWLASILISALLSTVFALPVRAALIANVVDDSSRFEPVNPPQYFWNTALARLNAEVEEWLTPMRATNADHTLSGDDDKNKPKKKKTSGEKKIAPSSEKTNSADNKGVNPKDKTGQRNFSTKSLIKYGSATAASLSSMEEGEFRSSFTPENNLGSPNGQVEAQASNQPAALRKRRFVERIGSANFNFEVPVASLPGRAIDGGIGLFYNSRVWNYWRNLIAPQNSRYLFNIDEDWLAPGFKLSLGQVQYLNYYNASITSPDGTRHHLSYISGGDTARTYESTDGTFTRLYITTSNGRLNNTALVKYPDGTSVTFTSLEEPFIAPKFFPTKIIDRNGNTINIAYRQNDPSGRIWYIRDTLNRYINFYYDSGNKLVAVTAPGFDGGGERQTIRFYYETMNFDTTTPRFQGVNYTMPASANMLKYVYFPGTNTGYKYDYSPAWGMIYRISDLRGMQVSSMGLTETGAVTTEGQVAASTEYNYPLTLGAPLPDVPKFTTRTDDWLGRTAAQPVVTTYEVERDTTINRTKSKIKSPDGTITETWSKIAPHAWDDGLVTDIFSKTILSIQQQTYKTWAHTKLFWGNQPGTSGRQNPRVIKTEQTNDADQTRATTFEYDGYLNQTLIKEHDFAAPDILGTELKRTEMAYATGAEWVNNRLVSLPTLVKTTVNGNVVLKTVIEYDNNGAAASSNLIERPDIDPLTHDTRFSWSSAYYDPTTDYRGNPTKITAFSDASLSADPNAEVTTMKYDIAGNLTETGANCCKRKAWEFSKINEYAYPIKEKRGDQSQLEISFTYDRNTGLAKTMTDENGQTTLMTYNPNNLRLTRADRPNGAWETKEYNDAVFPYSVKSSISLDINRSVSGWSFINGRGQAYRTRSQTANGFLSSDIEFDNMGRADKNFNPYTVTNLNDNRPAGIKFSQITRRDGLGRVLEVKLPDETLQSTEYLGLTATMTDQTLKQRRQIADNLGRIVRVDEPDSYGNLGDLNSPLQPTYYEYDGNNNLTKVRQTQTGGPTQERLFKYDSLSRITHERQVEAIATLDNNGVKVDTGGLWTGVYKYDTEGLLLEGADARGVKTALAYDGLNRVRTVVYTGETGYQTPNVTYTYDETEAGFYNNGRLTKVQTSANAAYDVPETIQNYDYNKVGQVVKHIQSIGSQIYSLEYGYNLAGQLVSEKYPSGKIINTTIDNFGMFSTVSEAGRTYLNGVLFNDRGLLSQLNLGNGTHETYSFNDRFQMTSQSLQKGTEVLQKYDYSYGTVDLANGTVDASKNNGQLGKIEGWIGANKQWSQRFTYDEIGRLNEAREYKQGDNAQLTYRQKFDFDRFGNLYRKAANNNPAGQQNPLTYTPIEESDISKSSNRFTTGTTYNEAGQVITDTKFRNMGFAYDANGRMIKATKPNTPDALTVYDALGNRVATKINDVWTFVIYDSFGKLVAEYGGMSATDDGGVRYMIQDWQGSPRAVVSNSGYVQSRSDFTAFGEEIASGVGLRASAQGYGVTSRARQGYGLTEKDAASGDPTSGSGGLNHTWFRKNENRAGRWTSPDPYNGSMKINDPQSINRYSYVNNDPINFVDPSGLTNLCSGYVWLGESTRLWLCEKMSEFVRSPSAIGGISGQGRGGSGGGAGNDDCPKNELGVADVKCLLRKALEKYKESPAGKFEDCLAREMKSLNRELRTLMNRNYSNWKWATGAAAFFGTVSMNVAIVGISALGGSFVSLVSWYNELADFNNEKYEPARQAAISKCRKETGYNGNLNGRLNTNVVTL